MPISKWSAAALALVLAGPALAQTATAPRDPNMPSPQTVPAEKVRPEGSEPGTTGSTTGENLTERLKRNEGVLTPGPTGDNEIVSRPPDTGTTPVIRPPGMTNDSPVNPK
ncbi:hypothetical protein [Salinarimonas soli]|uniref:Serine/threonine protein kinase n=1 Tax=Salinarimonas soli TaxID=1638099 RepID=A0A5B2VCF2_9HYPH|nr:hypothetical protein [Salinarimonas soli]KAA2236664.1 hypothetical protein F0L46_13590 [Salinarimonas soli]